MKNWLNSLSRGAALMAGLMMLAILLTLWVAVRSAKIIAAILLTLFAGLAITTAFMVGHHNAGRRLGPAGGLVASSS